MSTRPTFSIIIPTIARSTLRQTLASIPSSDLIQGDEILVCADGDLPLAEELVRTCGLPARYLATEYRANDYGGTPRNLGLRNAHGDYVLYMDDDDVFTDTAIPTIRTIVEQRPPRPYMFRMRRITGDVRWHSRRIAVGNVGTPMFVCPRKLQEGVSWKHRYGHDYDFIASVLAPLSPDTLEWREEITCFVGHVLPRSRQARTI